MTRILKIDTSARKAGSITRELNDKIVARLAANGPVETVARDLSDGISLIDEAWVSANFTPQEDRDPAQHEVLALSNTLIEEIQAADVLVIGVPIYNFGVPAALKAWIDQVARAGVTFRYTPDGPVGLLEDKRAILTIASGGVPVGSPADHATDYMRHVLGFIGITEVEIVRAERQSVDPAAAQAAAEADIAALAA
ncbi:MAG: NAD(P)H-dependent oxidoreductase [Pseudomonadota bacterium]